VLRRRDDRYRQASPTGEDAHLVIEVALRYGDPRPDPRIGGPARRAAVERGISLLYLNRFDTALDKANIPFVRFADAFLLFAPAREATTKARDFAASELERLDLVLHPGKTGVVRGSSKVGHRRLVYR